MLKKDKKKLLRFILFVILGYLVLIGLYTFLFCKYELSLKEQKYQNTTLKITREIKTLMQEKSESTMHLSLALANDPTIGLALKNDDPSALDLKTFSNTLSLYTSLKNVWIQVIRSDGRSFYRSWSPRRGDNVLNTRKDIVKFLQTPSKPSSSISVGIFDLTFKAMVPIYYENEFIGVFEVITHFNSIAKKMRALGYEPVILVDKSYKEQLMKPFTKTFVNDYYVANLDANKSHLKYLNSVDVSTLVNMKHTHTLLLERNELVILHTLNDIYGTPMAYFLIFKPIESIDTSSIEALDYQLLTIISILYLMIVLLVAFFFEKHENRKFKTLNNKLVRLNHKLRENEKLLDENIIFSSTDLDGNIIHVSKAFCDISEYTKEELMGQNHRLLKHPDMDPKVHKEIWDTITSEKTWSGELKNKPKHSEYYWNKQKIYPTYNHLGEKIGYTAIGQNITDKKIIEELSITDGLTNIYNRRYFNELFPKVINAAKRDNALVSFLMMDIDHFKLYNDTYGHQMGDTALSKVAACMKNSLKRSDDYCFRLGGEEFGVIFKVDSKAQAVSFANDIKQKIEELKISHASNSASSYVTVSIGLVSKHAREIKSEHELYKETDDLLYKAKESGRNTVAY